tara:strand:+ start:954 stop:1304 length:351 start_codon:yes stop_codon:yes gene_type:complete
MSYNLVERARKLAKLPAFTRNGVSTTTKRVTQDQFADFIHAVGEVGKELGTELDNLRDRERELLDKCHEQSVTINKMEREQWAINVSDNVKVVAASIDLAADDTKKLIGAVQSVAS